MSHYFIDNFASDTGTHEVHALGCKRMPVDKRYLGNFNNADEAMIEARKDFWQSDGCGACARRDRTDHRLLRSADFSAPDDRIR